MTNTLKHKPNCIIYVCTCNVALEIEETDENNDIVEVEEYYDWREEFYDPNDEWE